MSAIGKRILQDWVGKTMTVVTLRDNHVQGELAEVGDDGVTLTVDGRIYFVPWASFDYAHNNG